MRRDVLERPGHARDVAQRRGLVSALVERAGGLTLEVQHHPGPLEPQHLGQVQVTVDPDRRRRGPRRPAAVRRSPRCGPSPGRSVADAGELGGHVARPGIAVGGLGTEGLGQRDVQVRHLFAQQPGVVGEVELAVPRWAPQVEQLPQRAGGQLRSRRPGCARSGAPRRGPSGCDARPPTGTGTRAVADLAESLGHLDVGVRARLHLAEHLQDVALVEHQRGVGLLARLGTHRVQVQVRRDVVREGQAELVVGERVEQVRLTPGCVHPTEHRRVGQVSRLAPAWRRAGSGTSADRPDRGRRGPRSAATAASAIRHAGCRRDGSPPRGGPRRSTSADRPGTRAAARRAVGRTWRRRW